MGQASRAARPPRCARAIGLKVVGRFTFWSCPGSSFRLWGGGGIGPLTPHTPPSSPRGLQREFGMGRRREVRGGRGSGARARAADRGGARAKPQALALALLATGGMRREREASAPPRGEGGGRLFDR